VIANVVQWFLYAPVGVAVLSLAAIVVVAAVGWATVMAVLTGLVAVLTRSLGQERPDDHGASVHPAHRR
jgi:hypothetical protein